jgi:hypothetical protein
MINRDTLNDAKAFLCWDVLPSLSVQLAEKQGAVSFFFPPSNHSLAVVFFEKDSCDFSEPLFLLFHEAGHCLQHREAVADSKENEFWEHLEQPTGGDRVLFEGDGWKRGNSLFETFVERKNLPKALISQYNAFGKRSAESYR